MVDYELQGRVALLTLNRPEARNAVNGDVASRHGSSHRSTRGRRRRLGRRSSPHEGPVFSAGADLKAISSGQAGRPADQAGRLRRLRQARAHQAGDRRGRRSRARRRLRDRPRLRPDRGLDRGPVRPARGQALTRGGRRRAVPAPPPLPRKIALEIILTGDPISAERAYEFGLVNQLCEPGQALDAAHRARRPDLRQRARSPCGSPRRSSLETRRRARRRRLEAVRRGRCRAVASTEDFNEGPRAFIEKRPPSGRAADADQSDRRR